VAQRESTPKNEEESTNKVKISINRHTLLNCELPVGPKHFGET